jgi:dimeric dUTPase (all-alpha-NTP-PPase superfamily)
MNLQPLFETQKKLMDRIGYNEPDRFEKTILALLVEVGECANEWRGFKYWSKDQQPRTKGDWIRHTGIENGKFVDVYKNPLLEEYVDGLHFVMQIGLELSFTDYTPSLVKERTVVKQFNRVYICVMELSQYQGRSGKLFWYEALFNEYLALGRQLGFTWEQIEVAYLEKNKINHARQESGY